MNQYDTLTRNVSFGPPPEQIAQIAAGTSGPLDVAVDPSRPWLQTRNSVEPGPVLPAEHHVGAELLEVEPAGIVGHGGVVIRLVARVVRLARASATSRTSL